MVVAIVAMRVTGVGLPLGNDEVEPQPTSAANGTGTGTVDVDLSSLGESDLSDGADGRPISVELLPPARLDRPNLDQSATRLLSQESGLFDRVGDTLYAREQQNL